MPKKMPFVNNANDKVKMRKSTGKTLLVTLAAIPILVTGSAIASTFLPEFSRATFLLGARIDNPYFPLLDNKTRVFIGEKEEDGEIIVESFELTNLGSGPIILGVQTTIQRDRAFEDGLLVEETFDYYAQDTDGNVWYFGEDVTNFEYDDDGNLTSTNNESAWIAGGNLANPTGDPAQPGWIMPALSNALVNDFNYYQEFAIDDGAIDQGTQLLPLIDLSLKSGNFTDVLRVVETSAQEPGVLGIKYYAPGVGLIFEEEGLDENLQNPEISLALTAVPEPTSLLGILALVGLGCSYKHKQS